MPHALRRHPPEPQIANRYVGPDLNGPITAADGGQQSEEHPVHVRVTWEHHDGTTTDEHRWGLVTSWTPAAVRVHFWRHGEHWAWFARDDVERCDCTQLHRPGHWGTTSP